MSRVAITKSLTYEQDEVNKAVAEIYDLLGFDRANPLGHIVKSGDRVFIKPNWVAGSYRKSCKYQDNIFSTITHPSLIRAVADSVAKALNGRGKIIIGDNPSIDANFQEILEVSDLDDLKGRYEVPVEIIDLRPMWCADLKDYGNKSKMTELPGDPEGGTVINLGKNSLFYRLNPLLFRGVFTNRWETIKHHIGTKQEYSFSNSIYNSDVYISLPKLKSHHKVGATLNLKGLVGANYIKNYLIHWRIGFPGIGGDEYPNFKAWLRGFSTKIKHRGAWHGNDTCWRMTADLFSIFINRGLKTFSIIDGIVGGEGNGPFCPRSKNSQLLIGGENLIDVDCVGIRLMDYNLERIQYIKYLKPNRDDVDVVSKVMATDSFFSKDKSYQNFTPPKGWEILSESK